MSDDARAMKENIPSSGNNLSSSSASDWTWKDTLISLAQQASVYGVAAGYCISASLLSIINKWAVMKFPYPGALTALQYFTSAFGVLLCGWLKLVEHDRLDFITLWKFLPAAIIFYLSLFTNSELLLHANVDTFIVFRSVVPMFVAIGETVFLNQPWPSPQTWMSLVTIFGGSVIYVSTDYQFTVTAYAWAVAYLVSMSIDFVYIKHVVMTIGLNTWGLVLYNNLEALMLFPLELLIMGELKKIKHDIANESNWYSFGVVLPVALSCLFGLSISFFGFSCRRAISATGFTVLGIVNKLLTVVINLVIWDKHSTLIGTIGLLICMLGGVFYQQATSKPKKAEAEIKTQSNDEEQKQLLEMQSTAQIDSGIQHNVYQEYLKLKTRAEYLQSSQRNLLGEDLEPLNIKELTQLEDQIEMSLKHIRQRKNQSIVDQLTDLKRKLQDPNEANMLHLEWQSGGSCSASMPKLEIFSRPLRFPPLQAGVSPASRNRSSSGTMTKSTVAGFGSGWIWEAS